MENETIKQEESTNNEELVEKEEVSAEAKVEPAVADLVNNEAVLESSQIEKNNEAKVGTKEKFAALKKFFTIKKIVILVVVIILLGLGFYFKGLFIAATVNGSLVSRFEIINNLEKASGQAMLESRVNEVLINQEADNRQVTISEEEIKAEFDKVENQLKDQGTTLDAALVENNITRDDLRQRIITQKKLEKMLSDKAVVTDAEVEQYIKDSGTTIQAGQEETAKTSIKENLRNTKLGEESKKLLDELNAKAKINYWVKY